MATRRIRNLIATNKRATFMAVVVQIATWGEGGRGCGGENILYNKSKIIIDTLHR